MFSGPGIPNTLNGTSGGAGRPWSPWGGDQRAHLRYTASVGMIRVWQAGPLGPVPLCVWHPRQTLGQEMALLSPCSPAPLLGIILGNLENISTAFSTQGSWGSQQTSPIHRSSAPLSHKSSSCWERAWLGYQHQLPAHLCLWNKASVLSQEAQWPARLSVEGKSGWDAPVHTSVQNPRSELASFHPRSLLETPAKGVHWPGKDPGQAAEWGCRVS